MGLDYALLGSSLKSVSMAPSSRPRLIFLRLYFQLNTKCGFTREGRGGKGKEKVKAPSTPTNSQLCAAAELTHDLF